ncbi:MAG TPA: OmpA family protein [Bacteroidia bacterium]|jgi:outer membrane protein OmpA-like peptidoglycan-associated protein|nr:OmpA family protein [Bacteroidia bacterium]
MKKLLLMGCCVLATTTINAQTPDKKWNIGFHGGLTQYNGDRGQSWYTTKQAAYAFGGASVSRYLGRYVDLTLFGNKGEIGNIEPLNPANPERTGPERHFLASFTTATLALRINLTPPEYALRPYLFAGGSALYYEKKYTVGREIYSYAAPTGGFGLNIQMGRVVSLQLQETFMYTGTDYLDNEIKGLNDSYLMHTVGLTFNLGKKKDADLDGVADRMDKCPNTPTGVAVDKTGCPLDRDGDGVPDYQDECADAAGVAAFKGCPDKDNDGTADKDDRCPDVAGTVALKGCPDKDGDGVVDIDDKCADTDKKYKVDATGCPVDTDKDGVLNEDDACPEVKGIASLKGCADTDGDGVADPEDRCPAVKGTLANKGCPEISKEDVKKITQIASKIYFETNSAKLKPVSSGQLDALVEILKKYEGANLTIEGHTDNVGNDDYNMELSQKRTESVKNYLMTKGILESRLTAKGYGETKPIADNKTATGRSKNRRVELVTSY